MANHFFLQNPQKELERDVAQMRAELHALIPQARAHRDANRVTLTIPRREVAGYGTGAPGEIITPKYEGGAYRFKALMQWASQTLGRLDAARIADQTEVRLELPYDLARDLWNVAEASEMFRGTFPKPILIRTPEHQEIANRVSVLEQELQPLVEELKRRRALLAVPAPPLEPTKLPEPAKPGDLVFDGTHLVPYVPVPKMF